MRQLHYHVAKNLPVGAHLRPHLLEASGGPKPVQCAEVFRNLKTNVLVLHLALERNEQLSHEFFEGMPLLFDF